MIIICPACDTKFMVSASAMGEQGRVVRCAKCSHQWHAKPYQESYELEQPPVESSAAAEENVSLETPEAEEEAFTPDDFDYAKAEAMAASLSDYAKQQEIPLGKQPIWKFTAAALLLVCALVLGLIMRESLVPPLGGVFKSFGYYPEDGITLADVSLKQLPTRRHEDPRYDILCTIVNQSKETRRIPQLAMKIISKDGFVLAEEDNVLQNTGEKLFTGHSAPCKGLRFANMFSTATHVVVDLGSPIELSLRADWTLPADEEETEAEATEEPAEAETKAEPKAEEKPAEESAEKPVSETPFESADKPAEKEAE